MGLETDFAVPPGGYVYGLEMMLDDVDLKSEPSGGGGIYITRGIFSTSILGIFPISGLIMCEFCIGWRPIHIRIMFQKT